MSEMNNKLNIEQTIPMEKVDSKMSLEDALEDVKIPEGLESDYEEAKKNLELLDIKYLSFDGEVHKGQMVVHKAVVDELKEIFEKILDLGFPIEKAIPLAFEKYKWSDKESMKDNNSSAFNFRRIQDSERLSRHAFGLALDINPRQNPVSSEKGVFPEGAVHNPELEGTLTADSPVVKLFLERGWVWGGNWNSPVDLHHFQKELKK